MTGFWIDSMKSAWALIWAMDPELAAVVWVSVKVSLISTALASLLGIPAGFLIALNRFPGRRAFVVGLNTLLAMPTVVIGLLVYGFISRKGIFGSMGLLYTQSAIVIGQVILIFPVVTTLVISAVCRMDERYRKTAMTLGAGRFAVAWAVGREARFPIMAAVILAFGRVIAEVGISMMLGGNARGFTRTMTTAMALEYDKGEFVLAVALGLLLLAISFGINLLLHLAQGKGGR